MEDIKLTDLKAGEQAIVVAINGGMGLKRKAEAQGLRVGVKLTKLTEHFLRGPITIRINNITIAFGYGIAQRIIVKRLSEKEE